MMGSNFSRLSSSSWSTTIPTTSLGLFSGLAWSVADIERAAKRTKVKCPPKVVGAGSLRSFAVSWKTDVLNALKANVPIIIITAGSITCGMAGEKSRKAEHTTASLIMNMETFF